MTPTVTPLLAGLGPEELVLILIVILLLFGASKLPELARGSGRALRIFKAETKGLMKDDDTPDAHAPSLEQRELEARAKARAAEAEAEAIARERRGEPS